MIYVSITNFVLISYDWNASFEKCYYFLLNNCKRVFQFRKVCFCIKESIRKFFKNSLNKEKMWKKKYEIFNFQASQVLSCKIRSLLGLRLESSIFRNVRHFYNFFFHFTSLISWNIKKYKNSFSEIFLYVLSLGLKAHQVTQYYNTIFDNTFDSISIRQVEIYFQ